MKPDFLAQFAGEKKNGFVGRLESRTRVFLIFAKYRSKPVYYYLQLSSYRQQGFKQTLLLGKSFCPSEHGTILACGYGSPSPALKRKMEEQFKVFSS